MPTRHVVGPFAIGLLTAALGCSGPKESAAPAKPEAAPAAATAAPAPASKAEDGEPLPPPTYEMALPEAVRPNVEKQYTGDLKGMLDRRMIRVGVTFNRTFYFIDQGTQRGLAYEYATAFEEALNKKLNTGNIRVHLVLLPMPRDVLFPALQQGKIDMVVAQLTVTPARRAL